MRFYGFYCFNFSPLLLNLNDTEKKKKKGKEKVAARRRWAAVAFQGRFQIKYANTINSSNQSLLLEAINQTRQHVRWGKGKEEGKKEKGACAALRGSALRAADVLGAGCTHAAARGAHFPQEVSVFFL